MAISRESAPQKNNTALNRPSTNSSGARASNVADGNQVYRSTGVTNIPSEEDPLGYGRIIRLIRALPKKGAGVI